MGQNWEKMLNTNGGLLELKKCYWLIISWKWKEGVAHLKEVKELDATMTIRQTEGDKEITIPRKSVIEAPKILGCHVAANGNWEREAGRWKAEAVRFSTRIKKGKFNRTCGAKIYPSLWLAKLRYISSVVCFTKNNQ